MSFYYNANGQRMDMTTMGRCGRDRLLEATQDGYLDPQTVVEMSQDGLIFKYLSRVNDKTNIPVFATVTAGILTGLLATLLNVLCMRYSIVSTCY